MILAPTGVVRCVLVCVCVLCVAFKKGLSCWALTRRNKGSLKLAGEVFLFDQTSVGKEHFWTKMFRAPKTIQNPLTLYQKAAKI